MMFLSTPKIIRKIGGSFRLGWVSYRRGLLSSPKVSCTHQTCQAAMLIGDLWQLLRLVILKPLTIRRELAFSR